MPLKKMYDTDEYLDWEVLFVKYLIGSLASVVVWGGCQVLVEVITCPTNK